MAATLDPGGSDLRMSLVAELFCWRRQSASTGPFASEGKHIIASKNAVNECGNHGRINPPVRNCLNNCLHIFRVYQRVEAVPTVRATANVVCKTLLEQIIPSLFVKANAFFHSSIIIFYYMDDMLLCAPDDSILQHTLDLVDTGHVAKPEGARGKIQDGSGHVACPRGTVDRSNASIQLSLDSYSGQISVHAPSHKLFNEEFHLIPPEKRSQRSLKALIVFTEASRASPKSVMTWRNPQTQNWEGDVEFVEGSPKVAELATVVRAFEKFSEPINLVTDSVKVAAMVSRAEQAVLKNIENVHLFRLLSKLIYLISYREHPFYVMRVRSHTDWSGKIAEGNRQADSLAAPAEQACLPDIFQQAKLSHQQYHQNVPGLIRQFQLTRSQAQAILATCPSWQLQAMPSLGMDVNPCGLGSCEVWQTDIRHIPSFGCLKYVHVSIDTYSGAVYASAHAGERTVHAKQHLVQGFSVLGIPREIKTNNGPEYALKEFLDFVQQWGVEHKTGIPHSPTGQVVIERAHHMLKQILARQEFNCVDVSTAEAL
ncbi:hypothetical protein TURU_015008 [Turdus rufiventris]|nr:hypothetical protein TURU_015008 [Turdus rufiventris]